MPYGEEAYIGVGNRAVGHGYTYGDSTRQKFTGYERDEETNLDFAQAMMHNYNHGRFTSPDPLIASAISENPQTWNRYSYVVNNPLNLIDPSGMIWLEAGDDNFDWVDDKDYYDSDGNVVEKYKDRIVANGTVTYFGEAWGSYADGKYDDLRGGYVTLNDDGTLSAARDPNLDVFDDESGLATSSLEAVNTVNGLLYTTSGTAQYSAVNGNYWRGLNGKMYEGFTGRGPNQYTGSRSIPIKKAKIFNVAGKTFFVTGTAITVAQVANGVVSPGRGALDVGMGAVGAFGGPKGMIISGGYFLYMESDGQFATPKNVRVVNTNTCHGGDYRYNPRFRW